MTRLGAMRGVLLLLLIGFATEASERALAAPKAPFRDSFKTAEDGITKGWLIEVPWPDQDDASQNWRTIAVRLEIARHGHVIRRVNTIGFWSWNFWANGKEIVYEAGPVHGITSCARMDVRTGRTLEVWPGDCRDLPETAPEWVKAAEGSI